MRDDERLADRPHVAEELLKLQGGGAAHGGARAGGAGRSRGGGACSLVVVSGRLRTNSMAAMTRRN